MEYNLRKKIITFGVISGVMLALVFSLIQNNSSEIKTEKSEITLEADVIMPTKVSRPGCEKTNSCYVPSIISINKGDKVTWSNEDVAFHSVTSGTYDNPTELFDSGHMDPGQKFTVSFEEKGQIDYFCTLHPWMEGRVLVE